MYQGRVSVDFIIHCVAPVVDDVGINKLVPPCTFESSTMKADSEKEVNCIASFRESVELNAQGLSSARELFSDPNLAPVSGLLNFEIFNPATGILSDPDLHMPPAKEILNNRELVCAPVTRMHNDPCLHNAKEKTNMPSLSSHKTVLDVSSCSSLAREKVISHSLTSGKEQLVVSACMSSHQREIVTDNAIDPPISTVIVEMVPKSERVNAKMKVMKID